MISIPFSNTQVIQIKNETVQLNDTIDQMDFTDLCRIFHPTATECTLFNSPWNFLQNKF
jgi:hypothetical protein